MATAEKETKSNGNPGVSGYEDEIRAEMAEIRNDIAALTKSLGKYGKARADDMQASATDFTEEMLAESRRAVKKLGKQVTRLEKNMETNVREHPLQWFLGAVGVGLLVTMLTQRKSD